MFGLRDYAIEVPSGRIPNVRGVNKYGRSTNVDAVATDIIDDTTNVIWDAPTQARIHNIDSTDADDDGSPAGDGARTLRVYGLTSWDESEVSEDIVMNGTDDVATANAYVIIHRMRVLTKGDTASNVGIIKATAQTDNTVTAQINALMGQTQMAVLGVPSTETAYMTQYYATMNRTLGSAAGVDITLLVNPEPDAQITNFLTKHTRAVLKDGTSGFIHSFNPYYKIPGPAIIKVQGFATAADVDVSTGFDLYLVKN